MLQLLLFSGLAFFVLLPFMKRTLTISLDVDWFWRRLGAMLAREFTTRSNRARGITGERLQNRLSKALETVFHFHGPKGILARNLGYGHHDVGHRRAAGRLPRDLFCLAAEEEPPDFGILEQIVAPARLCELARDQHISPNLRTRAPSWRSARP